MHCTYGFSVTKYEIDHLGLVNYYVLHFEGHIMSISFSLDLNPVVFWIYIG